MKRSTVTDSFPKWKKSEESDNDHSSREKIAKITENSIDDQDNSKVETTNEPKETKPSKQISSFGKNYMLKLGYKEGKGLGKYQDGRVEPVEASKQRGRRGLGFEATDLKDAVSKYDPSLEEISLDEEVIWLTNDYCNSIDKECLDSWVKIGLSKKCIAEDSLFCDSQTISKILSSKNILNEIIIKDLENGKRASNPFESIKNAIFLNRAAMKMANLDAILDWMFTQPKNINGDKVVKSNELLYFADVCAGPGGFSEYILFRKKWKAKGFGFTLKHQNDFMLEQFWAGPSESFEPYYGVMEDGNVYTPENIISFKEHVMKHTDGKGVHFMMADGGVHIDEKFNDQELICKKLYLCQCLIALLIVRTDGHFVVKLFDLFTEFSVGLIYLMYRSFREILIIKPNTSRPANSERYLVCKWKRDDCGAIAEHLFEINKRVPEYCENGAQKEDVLELVPTDILLKDEKFYNYIRNFNIRFGKKQIVGLLKLAAFSENSNLLDEKQQELRKACLKKWNIPDEARAEPKKSDPRTKWTELLGNSSLCSLDLDIKKHTIQLLEEFKKKIVSKYSWYCLVLSREENDGTFSFYLGLGRNHVYKYAFGKWTKLVTVLSSSGLCLPANTLVYGELVKEYLGSGKGQRKINAFHIIDGLFLGNEDIRQLHFMERLNRCRLFAKALYKETFPVRVKSHFSLADFSVLKSRLIYKPTKSSSTPSLCFPLESDSFFKAGGIMFIRDTRDACHRYLSKSKNSMYLNHSEKRINLYEHDDEIKKFFKELYGDFEHSFRTKLIWWWDEEMLYNNQLFHEDSCKLTLTNISNFIDGKI